MSTQAILNVESGLGGQDSVVLAGIITALEAGSFVWFRYQCRVDGGNGHAGTADYFMRHRRPYDGGATVNGPNRRVVARLTQRLWRRLRLR